MKRLLEQAPVADQEARFALMTLRHRRDRPVTQLIAKSSDSRVTTATSPPHSVVFSPIIEFCTASLMTRMTTSSRTDICPTSRFPEIRIAATTKR